MKKNNRLSSYKWLTPSIMTSIVISCAIVIGLLYMLNRIRRYTTTSSSSSVVGVKVAPTVVVSNAMDKKIIETALKYEKEFVNVKLLAFGDNVEMVKPFAKGTKLKEYDTAATITWKGEDPTNALRLLKVLTKSEYHNVLDECIIESSDCYVIILELENEAQYKKLNELLKNLDFERKKETELPKKRNKPWKIRYCFVNE